MERLTICFRFCLCCIEDMDGDLDTARAGNVDLDCTETVVIVGLRNYAQG